MLYNTWVNSDWPKIRFIYYIRGANVWDMGKLGSQKQGFNYNQIILQMKTFAI